jgi:hypothetical protein
MRSRFASWFGSVLMAAAPYGAIGWSDGCDDGVPGFRRGREAEAYPTNALSPKKNQPPASHIPDAPPGFVYRTTISAIRAAWGGRLASDSG